MGVEGKASENAVFSFLSDYEREEELESETDFKSGGGK